MAPRKFNTVIIKPVYSDPVHIFTRNFPTIQDFSFPKGTLRR
jgi:hypothetical protein